MSTIHVERILGYLEDELGRDHPVVLLIEVLETPVDQPPGAIKKPNGGIRGWEGAPLPDGDYWAKFAFLGQKYRWPRRLIDGKIRNRPGNV